MFGLGTTELIVIGVIIFLIFGAKRIPDIGKGLGGAIKEFRNIKKDITGAEEGDQGEENNQGEEKPPALENKIAGKVLNEIPGVKKVMDVKDKVEKVKKINR